MLRALSHRAYALLSAAAIIASLCHRWPILQTGFMLDDYAQLAMLRGIFPARPAWASAQFSESVQPRRTAAGIGLGGLIMAESVGPPCCAQPTLRGLSEAVRRSLLTPEVDAVMRNARRVLLLSAADPTTTIYLPSVRRVYNRSFPRMYQLLSSSSDVQRLQRLSTHTFALDRHQKHLSPLDGRPMRTVYHLDLSLDDSGVVLLQQAVCGLLRVSFPPVGASMLVNPPVPPYALIANSTGLDS